MMTKLKFLTKMSLKKKMVNKWFVVANIFLLFAIVAISNIDSIITIFGGDFNKPTIIYVLDNTNQSYDAFEHNFELNNKYLSNIKSTELSLYEKTLEEAKEEVKEEKIILITIDYDEQTTLKSDIIVYSSIDQILLQVLINTINTTKSFVALENSNVTIEDLNSIYSPATISQIYLDETSSENNNELLMGAIFPLLILPFFMLSLYLVQMIGAEINDEKTTRSMEIIIGNVSPKTHFFSKVLAGNMFVILQGLLLFIYGLIGLLTRNLTGGGNIIESFGNEAKTVINDLVATGFLDKLIIIIPVTLILIVLSFLSYSLLAGILASMTTSIEDYQQLQLPIVLISLTGYYLSVMSTLFSGSLFIRLMSYVPFISALLAPALLILGEITLIDVSISIAILFIFNYLLIKYGLRIYKVGILNYSSNKLWTKIFKAIKNEDVV